MKIAINTVLKIGHISNGHTNKYQKRWSFTNWETTSRRNSVTLTREALQVGMIDTRAVILTTNQETVQTIFVKHGKDRQHSDDFL